MNRETFLQNMDNYIDGLLSKQEEDQFLSILKSDQTMLEEYNLHKKARRAIIISGRQEKLLELDTLKASMHTPVNATSNKTNRSRRFLFYGIAASLVVLVGFAYSFYQNDRNLNKTESINRDYAMSDYDLIETRVELVSIRPRPGKLGAAPQREILINIYCCKDSLSVEKNEFDWMIFTESSTSKNQLDSFIYEVISSE